jgi:hypothetical protein
MELGAAIREHKLDQLIAQEEARGIGPIDRAELDQRIADLIRAPFDPCVTIKEKYQANYS